MTSKGGLLCKCIETGHFSVDNIVGDNNVGQIQFNADFTNEISILFFSQAIFHVFGIFVSSLLSQKKSTLRDFP